MKKLLGVFIILTLVLGVVSCKKNKGGDASFKMSKVNLNGARYLALANKESLVVGGELINKLLKQRKGKLYPIDSEHSALWKCLKVDDKNVDKMIITASGGFYRYCLVAR